MARHGPLYLWQLSTLDRANARYVVFRVHILVCCGACPVCRGAAFTLARATSRAARTTGSVLNDRWRRRGVEVGGRGGCHVAGRHRALAASGPASAVAARPEPDDRCALRIRLLVYEAVGLGNPWDGTYNGERLPVDTYYYTIDLQLSFIKKIYKGAVTILR